MGMVMAHKKPKDQVSTVDLRVHLRKLKKRVISGEVIPIYQFFDLVGYFMSAEKAEAMKLEQVQDFKTDDFRAGLTDICDRFFRKQLDVAFLQSHGRRVAAIVSPSRVNKEDGE